MSKNRTSNLLEGNRTRDSLRWIIIAVAAYICNHVEKEHNTAEHGIPQGSIG